MYEINHYSNKQEELSYAGQEVEVTDTMTSFENEYQKIEISLAKYMETKDTFGIGNNGEYKAALFGLFVKTTTEYKVDNAIMTAVSDENGCFSFTQNQRRITYGKQNFSGSRETERGSIYRKGSRSNRTQGRIY